MQIDNLVESAALGTTAIIRAVRDDQLGAPTPCGDWDVRTLANHLLQVVRALRLTGQGQAVPGELWGSDLMSGQWADQFDQDARAAIEAWSDPEALAGVRDVGGMELPAALAATMFVSDLAIHGWDLARATGQEYGCAEPLAVATERFVVDMGEQGRQMGIYAEPVTVGAEASPFDRVLGLSGRDPRWTPAQRA